MSLVTHCFLFICLLAAIQCQNSDINYGNLYRYMSLPPQDLNRLIDLLQEPKFSGALVRGDESLKKDPFAAPPRYAGNEDERRLIYYLLGYTSGPHEPYTGGFADHKGHDMIKPRTFNTVYKLWRGEDGFPDRRGDYEMVNPSDKLVPTLL